MLAYIVHPHFDDPSAATIRDVLVKLECETIHVAAMSAAAQDPRIAGTNDSIVVVPTSDKWRPEVGQLIKDSSRLIGRAFIIYIADTISPADYKALIRLGSADSIDWDSALHEINGIIERLKVQGLAGAPKEPVDTSNNRVVSFVGTGGGAGNTTMALESGVLLASASNGRRRVALLDLELRESVVCDYLDIAPRLDLDAFAHNPERLDDYMLDILASRHSSGLEVFACAKEGGSRAAAAGAETAVYLLLNRLLERYNIVIVDVPAHRASDVDEILRNSDFIFVTSLFSVPSIKRSKRMAQRIDALPIPSDRRAVIVNDSESNFLGAVVRRFDVEHALPGERLFFVRRDRQFALECVDAGFSMALTDPKRGISKDLAKLAELVEIVKPAVAAAA